MKDLDLAIALFKEKVRSRLDKVGAEAVDYAVRNGTYRNVTGRLRSSNQYEAAHDGLRIFNTAPYASDVEDRGHDVLSGAVIQAKKELESIFI